MIKKLVKLSIFALSFCLLLQAEPTHLYRDEIFQYEETVKKVMEQARESKEVPQLLKEQLALSNQSIITTFLNLEVAAGKAFVITSKSSPKTMHLAEKIAAKMELSEIPIIFVKLDNDFFNAYAVKLPFINKPMVVIGTGILQELPDDAFEALLAHEFAHLKCQHSLKILRLAIPFILASVSGFVYQRVLSRKMSKLEGFYTSLEAYRNANQEMFNYERQYANIGLVWHLGPAIQSAVSLGYSRKHEFEADLVAMKTLEDPSAVLHLLAHSAFGEASNESSWLSTHPSFQDRIAYITEEANKMKKLAEK